MIGVFDSGIGGLSVWREIHHLLPDVSTLYLGDQAYAPYGDRPPDQIAKRGFQITQYLESQGARLIVIACNTATVNITVANLRHQFPHLNFVGVEPPIKPLAALTQTGKIAVYATTATCNSPQLKKLIRLYAPELQVHVTPTPEWAPLVEAHNLSSLSTRKTLEKYILPHLEIGIDFAGLGCTHYPFLKPMLEQITQGKISFLDNGLPVAKRVQALLGTSPSFSSHPVFHRFVTTSTNTLSLSSALANLLNLSTSVESVII